MHDYDDLMCATTVGLQSAPIVIVEQLYLVLMELG